MSLYLNLQGYIIDGDGEIILDMISHEPIHTDKSICIDKQVYNIESLYNYIKYYYNNNVLATIPHNREPFTEDILQNINSKLNETYCSETYCSYKSEIIIELIKLSKFSKKTQEYLLYLEYEQRKSILKKYDHLLNNDISEEIIKDAIKYNYISLLFVPIDKMTNDVIKFALKNNSRSLQYVPDYLKTEEIIKLAVQNDGDALQYVPDYLKTEEIIKLAVRNDYTFNSKKINYILLMLLLHIIYYTLHIKLTNFFINN
jgi:hypothetical protein